MRGLVAVLALLVPFAGGSEAARAPVPRGEIFVVGVDGRGRQNLTRTAATESELALSPDGRRIAYVHSERQQFQVWVMNDDGSRQRRLTSGGDWEFGPQWSPDGDSPTWCGTSPPAL
ncbi:MAG: TolB family protein, partial [Gaiellaceae bacterium]